MNFQPNPLGNITPDNDKAKVREVIETTPSEKLSITLTHHTHTITCEGKKETISTKKDLAFNRREFVKHVLSANPDFANAALLILTVCQNKLPFPKELSYSTYQGDLTALRNQPIHRGPLVMETAKEFFDYREDGDSYIDFANAFRFGGAWNTHGCVQEERMFAEFLELALLDFLTKGKVHPVLERNYFKPAPFVVEGIRRTFDISKTPYGTKFHGIRDSDTMKSMISEVQDSPRVNIVGLAALDYRSDSLTRGYNINHWYYHFDAFVLACMSGKRIHTADWGCGAFRGNVEAIIAIQYLASVVSNVPIVLHGVDNVNDKFKQENVEKAKGAVDALLGQGKTANEILNTLFNKHPEWKPRN